MALRIDRKKDNRTVKCILHRVADIPGGVTVSATDLGGKVLQEGTPLGKGSDGIFNVCKTALILTQAEATATTYEVVKGHHFKVGDRFATDVCKGQTITAIDKSDVTKDIITLEATLGAQVKKGACAFESSGNNMTPKVTPLAIAGSNYDVESNDNLLVDAWVQAVVRESNAPIMSNKIKDALKVVSFV